MSHVCASAITLLLVAAAVIPPSAYSRAVLTSESAKERATVEQVVLDAIHPLFGGDNVYIQRSGRLVVRTVEKDRETRYEATVSTGEFAKLEGLIDQHNFFRMRTQSRSSEPDYFPNFITVWLSSGKVTTKAQLPGRNHKHFDPIYRYLLELAATAKATTPVFSGPKERRWWPDGYEKRPA